MVFQVFFQIVMNKDPRNLTYENCVLVLNFANLEYKPASIF